jgi:hypothetical protein
METVEFENVEERRLEASDVIAIDLAVDVLTFRKIIRTFHFMKYIEGKQTNAVFPSLQLAFLRSNIMFLYFIYWCTFSLEYDPKFPSPCLLLSELKNRI